LNDTSTGWSKERPGKPRVGLYREELITGAHSRHSSYAVEMLRQRFANQPAMKISHDAVANEDECLEI
jgi:hypothetical protein